jgi:hypothetical protein
MILLIVIAIKADEIVQKRLLRSNMTIQDIERPFYTRKVSDFLTKGSFYGRLRCNSFIFKAEKENSSSRDHNAVGVGGSLIYKSAYLYGVGFTTGFYTTQNILDIKRDDLKYYKAGKDVFSRYDFLKDGKRSIVSLAQLYIEYNSGKSSLKTGRLIFESLLTKSNDTKMIPNTFEGVTLQSKFFDDITYKIAYLTRQKLKDHSHFHHVLAYDGWKQNDDGAMHRGLLLSKLKNLDIEDRLLVFEADKQKTTSLQWIFNITAVPKLVILSTIGGSYEFVLNTLHIKPAFRYIRQFDDGAGNIGGANLKNNTFGYKNPKSVESSLYAAKIDLKYNAWKFRLGYSQVADKADLIAPWRGFPTGGFTRAMGQYNWYANTKTYMIRGDYNFDRAGLLYGTKIFFRYAIEDFDDSKPGVQADSRVLTLDILKNFKHTPDLYAKIRVAFVNGKNDTIAADGTLKSDPSYREFRFEVNYLF